MAAIVEPELFREFLNWRQKAAQTSLDQAFKELQQLCTEENYSLEIPLRSDLHTTAKIHSLTLVTRNIKDFEVKSN